MFENLSDKLQRVFKSLRGQGTLTEENIAEALREIRVASARGRRQPQRCQRPDRTYPREGRRQRSAHRALALRAGGQDRARRAGRAARQRHRAFQLRLQAAHGHFDGRTAGLRQNHHIRQAGRVAQEGRPPAHAGFGRRLPPRRARTAQGRRQVRWRRASTKAI